MLGAIVGDIIGSSHEFSGLKTKDFSLFGFTYFDRLLTSVTRQLSFEFSQKFQSVTKPIAINFAKISILTRSFKSSLSLKKL
jgi:hypothetical protein